VDSEALAAPADTEKSQQKWSHCRLENPRRNTIQRQGKDSEAFAALNDSGKVNENRVCSDWKLSPKYLPKVTRGFEISRSPC